MNLVAYINKKIVNNGDLCYAQQHNHIQNYVATLGRKKEFKRERQREIHLYKDKFDMNKSKQIEKFQISKTLIKGVGCMGVFSLLL